MIVNDAICHCDEAASLLHDRCELVFRKLVGRSGHPDLSPIVPALRATNKQTQVSLFNQIVSNFYLDKYHNIVEC